MSDFGVRIGKVLAAFGLCMVLFCVPAGADVKEDDGVDLEREVGTLYERLMSPPSYIIPLGSELPIKGRAFCPKLRELIKKLEKERGLLARLYFEKRGWSPLQAHAFAIYFSYQSEIEPTNFNGSGIGIAGWDKRIPALRKFAMEKGEDWTNLKLQLDFFQQELETTASEGLIKLREAKNKREMLDALFGFIDFYETIK